MDGMWREIKICVSCEEYEALRKRAEAKDESVTDLIRRLIADSFLKPDVVPPKICKTMPD